MRKAALIAMIIALSLSSRGQDIRFKETFSPEVTPGLLGEGDYSIGAGVEYRLTRSWGVKAGIDKVLVGDIFWFDREKLKGERYRAELRYYPGAKRKEELINSSNRGRVWPYFAFAGGLKNVRTGDGTWYYLDVEEGSYAYWIDMEMRNKETFWQLKYGTQFMIGVDDRFYIDLSMGIGSADSKVKPRYKANSALDQAFMRQFDTGDWFGGRNRRSGSYGSFSLELVVGCRLFKNR